MITTVVRVVQPGGVCAVIAESVLAKHQLLIFNRSRQRALNLPRPGSAYRWNLFALG
jgi:hypothetical protein